jgi:hypothetical protein
LPVEIEQLKKMDEDGQIHVADAQTPWIERQGEADDHILVSLRRRSIADRR